MEITRKDIIVKGRYNVWDLKDWLVIILFITLLALGLFFLTSPELRKYGYYPLGFSLLSLVFIILRVIFLGNFHVSRFNIVWKTMVGSIHSVAFDQIGDMNFVYSTTGRAAWIVNNKQGKRIKKFRTVSPLPAAGAAILFFRYKDLLPEMVFNLWKPVTKGKRTYEQVDFKLKIDGTLAHEAKGSIVLYESKLLYIPTHQQQTLSEPELLRIKKAGFVPEFSIYPADGNIKTHTLIEALLESNLPTAIRDAYIQKIVNENGGNIFTDMTRTGKQWQTYNEGVEVLIIRP